MLARLWAALCADEPRLVPALEIAARLRRYRRLR
jgi:hypothetical protein